MDSWLSFGSILIWQCIVLVALYSFRSELRDLLQRLARLKHGETEVTFRQKAPETLEPSPVVAEALQLRDPHGFFTSHGIDDVLRRSSYLDPDEQIRDTLPVLRTAEQHTWLIATDRHIFFILDDEQTRAKGVLIQYRLPVDAALPVSTERESASTGAFRLGKSDWWYYSVDLIGMPSVAADRLQEFIREAGASKPSHHTA